MSHGKIRAEKSCENCHAYVPDRYCSHCGQENVTTRQPFYYLLAHFVEDFTHYDSGFWQTLKNIFCNPGYLTVQYLAGKRQSMVNPVKLYIFVNFITFFILAVLPNKELTLQNDPSKQVVKSGSLNVVIQVDKSSTQTKETELDYDNIVYESDFEKMVLEPLYNKSKELKNKHISTDEFSEKFSHNMLSLIPKALFLYMPFFAFLLWLFHNKKKWWYFDHGVCCQKN
ncbi:DUF3667 domain-containing protein [Flavobacterium agricola]|uniref:DUF3667 domain-containing protein n=1 Tax=Flavobacterium agricola TaxID=2870839 RepID=A0ABY6M003_9FLAO|nr:DUF3667 domain-containing protein [Flavobacterium agricola]UYW01814.1 DUF3667 domain-containing protein [Flavobacterium agricola]